MGCFQYFPPRWVLDGVVPGVDFMHLPLCLLCASWFLIHLPCHRSICVKMMIFLPPRLLFAFVNERNLNHLTSSEILAIPYFPKELH